MDTLRSIARVLFFLVTIAALVVVALIGAEFIMGQLRPPPAPAAEAGQETERQINLASPEELILGLYLKVRAADLQKPASDDPTPVEFTVLPGETAAEVAQRLAEEGLITDAELFRRYMRFYGLDIGLEAGDYQLARNMTMEQIAKMLQHARINEVVVRVIEGWRAEQIAEMLEKEGLTTAAAFMNVVRTLQLPYPSLADRPAGASLEGYLFPDTYRLAVNATPEQIVERMVANFEERFDPARRTQAQAAGMTIHQVVTLASIVERETVVEEERPIIASVYLNRLAKGMYLQADPTVQYALGYQPHTGQWWLTPLPMEALTGTESIYNTYLHPGLPPGPICNPGLASIDAVLNPAPTDYLFFYSKGDGTHAFASTYEEHLRNQELYQR